MLIEAIKNIYPMRNSAAKEFVEKLTSFYLENDSIFENKLVPLVRKLMKFRDRMKLANEMIRKEI